MSKNNLINQVNDFFLTGSNVSIEEIDSKNNKIEKFYYHVVERLIKTYNLFLSDEKYLNDFLISLRDYLLTLDTELEIPNLQIDQQNDFGLIFHFSNTNRTLCSSRVKRKMTGTEIV